MSGQSNMTVSNEHHNYYQDFLSPIECERLSSFVLTEEPKVLSIPNPFTSPHTGLTAQHRVYNWLSHPTLKTLDIPKRLFNLPDFKDTKHIVIMSWMNVLRQTQRIAIHNHDHSFFHPPVEPNSFYSCNVFLSGNTTTGAIYEDSGYTQSELGEIHIVSNLLDHSVPSHLFTEPRISMALDVWIDDYPNELDNNEQNNMMEHYDNI